jgi:DNA polymerase-3 subunit epsilon
VTDTSLPEWANVLAVFDTETTGIETETTRIVSAHVSVLTPDGVSTEARNWLIDCGIEIPARATEVHGITTERMRAEGAPAADSIFELVTLLQGFFDRGIPVVAFNAPYDFSILDREAKRYGLTPISAVKPVIDPMIIDRQVDKYVKGKNQRTLINTAARYGVPIEGAHDASVDAIAAGRVAQAIGRKFAAQLAMSAAELHDSQVRWSAEQAASLNEYLIREGKTPYAGGGVWPIR